MADWEPVEALVAGPTGLECYKAIVPQAPAWLAPGGALVLEIGATQGPAVAALADAAGLVDVEVRADLAGFDRIVCAEIAEQHGAIRACKGLGHFDDAKRIENGFHGARL